MAWELKHSVIATADRRAVWQFVSNVDNLARIEGDAVESITLDGTFRTGANGITKLRGQEPIRWRLVEVTAPERTVTEIELREAVVRITWTYESLAENRTRSTQHMVLEAPGAEAYVPVMEANFRPNIGPGMARLAAEIAGHAATD
jgi:hypothetical protein